MIKNWGMPAQPWFQEVACSVWVSSRRPTVLLCLRQKKLVAGDALLNKRLSVHWHPSPGNHATTNCVQDPTFFLPRPIKLQCLLGVSTYDTCCGLRALAMGSWWRFQRSPLPYPPGRRLLARLKCSWQTSFSMLRKQLWCLQEYYSRPESSGLSPTCIPSGE